MRAIHNQRKKIRQIKRMKKHENINREFTNLVMMGFGAIVGWKEKYI